MGVFDGSSLRGSDSQGGNSALELKVNIIQSELRTTADKLNKLPFNAQGNVSKDIDLQQRKIINVPLPLTASSVASKAYVDNTIGGGSGLAVDGTGNYNANNKIISNVKAPVAPKDVVRKRDLDIAGMSDIWSGSTSSDIINIGDVFHLQSIYVESSNQTTNESYEARVDTSTIDHGVVIFLNTAQDFSFWYDTVNKTFIFTTAYFGDWKLTKIKAQYKNMIASSVGLISGIGIASIKTDQNRMVSVDREYLTNHIKDTFPTLYINEYFKNYAECMYKVDYSWGNEVTYDATTRKVSKLIDNTLSELDATQTAVAQQPKLCLKSVKINKRYYLSFDGASSQRMISSIDLNPATGVSDIVNVFIVYRLKSFTANSYWTRNGLFGHDNAGFDKFVSFGPNGDLVVAGASPNYIVVGSNTVLSNAPVASYQAKANAGEVAKWCCLSIHWVYNPYTYKSSVWCNGKKLANFTSSISPGSTQMTFGDLSPTGIAPLDGDIAFFGLYKGFVIAEDVIKLHHRVLCSSYLVDHDPIII